MDILDWKTAKKLLKREAKQEEKELKREHVHVDQKSLHFEDVEEDVDFGRVKGTIYRKANQQYTRGALLVHGTSMNRHSMAILAERLVACGYFCLSIDMPSHFLNTNKLTLGELSETISEALHIMNTKYGIRNIYCIGHSLGAIGTLYSAFGYTRQIEERLYNLWAELHAIIEKEGHALKHFSDPHAQERANIFSHQFIDIYTQIKQLILYALKDPVATTARLNVRAYVMLSAPHKLKTAIPGLGLLKPLSSKWLKLIFENTLHKDTVKAIQKEGNMVGYANQNSDKVRWGFLSTPNIHEFLDYLMHMDEPADYVSLIEALSDFKQRDEATGFIEYYRTKYILTKPKLFVYGTYDSLLRPFMPGAKVKIEKFYESCGNATIFKGSFNHNLTENRFKQFNSLVARNTKVTEKITKFLMSH